MKKKIFIFHIFTNFLRKFGKPSNLLYKYVKLYPLDKVYEKKITFKYLYHMSIVVHLIKRRKNFSIFKNVQLINQAREKITKITHTVDKIAQLIYIIISMRHHRNLKIIHVINLNP